jgi:DNA-directed RNA polymerase subunit RPC12/RpoP
MPGSMEELFKCNKCKQKYDLQSKRPKLLVCHHCFCMQCVQSMIKTKTNQTAPCPTCSKVTCIGRNGVAALPDNEYLLPQLKASLKTSEFNGKKQQTSSDYRDPSSEIFHSDEDEDYDFDPDDDDDGLLDEASGGSPNFHNGTLTTEPKLRFGE